MGDIRERMLEEGKGMGIHLDEEQLWKYQHFFEMLVDKNKVMNLTAITEDDEVVMKHFVDSLWVLKVFPSLCSGKPLSIIDVGTGAGFPGIPLKIAFPSCRILLVDSLNKRVGFLKEVCSALGLDQITAVHGRAEDLGRDRHYRERFELCVSRAVADLSVLSEYCMPFVKVGGTFISYKSRNVEEEVKRAQNAVRLLGGAVRSVYSFCLPGTEMERSFVVVSKDKPVSQRYPRKAGVPSKMPL